MTKYQLTEEENYRLAFEVEALICEKKNLLDVIRKQSVELSSAEEKIAQNTFARAAVVETISKELPIHSQLANKKIEVTHYWIIKQ